MANAFKKYYYQAVGTANTTVYNPTTDGIQSTIIGMSICNIVNTSIAVSVTISTGANAQSAGSNSVHLVKNVIIPPGTTLTPVGGNQKVVLVANSTSSDFLEVSSNTASSADILLSVLEIT